MALPREKTTETTSKLISETKTHRAPSAEKIITDGNTIIEQLSALDIKYPALSNNPEIDASTPRPDSWKPRRALESLTNALEVLASAFTKLASVDLNATLWATPSDDDPTPIALCNLGCRYQEVSSEAFALSYLCRRFGDSLGVDVTGDIVFWLPIVTERLIAALEKLSSALERPGSKTPLAGPHAPRIAAAETVHVETELFKWAPEPAAEQDPVETELFKWAPEPAAEEDPVDAELVEWAPEPAAEEDPVDAELFKWAPEPAAEQDPVDALTETLKTTTLTSSPARAPSPRPDFASLAKKYANSPFIFRVQHSGSITQYSEELGFTAGLVPNPCPDGCPEVSTPGFEEMFCSHLQFETEYSPFISTGIDLRFSVRGLHKAKRDKEADVKLIIIDSSKLMGWNKNAGKFLEDNPSVKAKWEARLLEKGLKRYCSYHQSEMLVWGNIPKEAIVATIRLADLERAVAWGVADEGNSLYLQGKIPVWKNLERVLALQREWSVMYVDLDRVIKFIDEHDSATTTFPWDDIGVVENSLHGLAGAIQRMLNVRDPEVGLFLMGVLLGWVVGYQPNRYDPKTRWDSRMGSVVGVEKLWESWREAERLWMEAEEERRREGRLIYDRHGALPVPIFLGPPVKIKFAYTPSDSSDSD